MATPILNLYVKKGSQFRKNIIWKDINKNLVNLTDYKGRMKIKEYLNEANTILTLTTENGGITLGGSAGTIDLYIGASDTTDITINTGWYDIEIYNPLDEDDIESAFQGFVNFEDNVTIWV